MQAVACEDLETPLFQAFFKNAPLGIALVDLQGRLFRVNPALESMFGRAESDLLGRTPLEFTHPEDTAEDYALFMELVAGKRDSYELKKRYVRHNGQVFPGNLTISIVRKPEGTPAYAVAMVQDLSHHQDAEAAVRTSERRYELAALAGRVGVWDLDLITNELYLAPNLKAMLGYRDEELPNKLDAWCALVHPDDKDRVIAATLDHLEGRTPVYGAEVRRRHKDGHYLWFLVRGTAELNSQGQPVRMTGSDTDITDRKLAEEQLRESEERLRLALDAGRCGTWDWDITQDRVHWSDRIYDLHGLVPGSFSGRVEDFAKLVHPEDSERVGLALRAALEDGAPYQIEFRTIFPSGEVRWLATTGRVLRGPDGLPYRMLGATIDTTDRVLAEEALRRANEQLELARDEALAASRAKSRFLANMSHELRTPLNAIIGYAEMIEESEPVAGKILVNRADVKHITDAGRHLLAVISDILDLTKIESGRLETALAPFDPRPAAHSACAAIEPLAARHSNLISVDCREAPSLLISDEVKLRQILINLLSNACKFTRNGVVRLTVRARGDWAEFIVADTGVGIAPEDMPRLFQEFVQLDTSATRQHGGTGLGLAISKRYCEHLGGTLTVSSEPGKGSTFTVALPLRGA